MVLGIFQKAVGTDLLDTVDANAFHGQLPLQLRFSIVLEAPPLHIQDPDFMVTQKQSLPLPLKLLKQLCLLRFPALSNLCLRTYPGDLPLGPHVRPHRAQGDEAARQCLRNPGGGNAHARYYYASAGAYLVKPCIVCQCAYLTAF